MQESEERADAARNRKAILEAAARLFNEYGVESVSMSQVAAAAGVGKGTLFRRFGNRSGLASELLTAHENELREKITHGPPPLGPGASPADRLLAFIDAYITYVVQHLPLVRALETADTTTRLRTRAYRFWHNHVTTLIGPGNDPETTAHVILANLSSEHIAALLPELGEQKIRAALRRLAYTALQ
ncbi:TetR/AcrR family transcriptional regulator [Streptomyces sp. NPDC002159]